MDVEQGLRDRNLPKEVAHKLVEVSDQVLAENLGREPTPEEIADLAEAMIAEILSGGYIHVRERGKGPQEAEAWLRKALAMGAAGVRMRGSDALIKIEVTVRDVPNKIARTVEPADQVRKDLATAAPCNCQKEADGRCPSCSQALASVYREFFGVFRNMARFQGSLKGLCRPCQLDQLDYAVSTVVGTIFEASETLSPENKAAFAQEMLALLYQMAVSMGVREMPMTIQAWKDTLQAKGITVEGPP